MDFDRLLNLKSNQKFLPISFQIAGKRDPEQEKEAQEWIELMLGEKFPDTFEASLRNGIILCKLMNKLRPGIIQKINISGGDYKLMDNISQFHRAAQHWGVPEVDLFNANDLYEQKNIVLVTQTIFAIGRAVRNFFKSLQVPQNNFNSISSAINIQNFKDHTLDHHQQLKIVVNSQKNS